MLIPNPARIQNEKGLLLLMVLDILRRSTDAAHPMSKQELLKRIEHDYGFKPARGTLNEKLNALEQAGFDVVQDGREGVYYDGADLSDGELRFLIDSVMYSTFTTRQGADDMISALMALGTPTFQKQMTGYISRTERTRKSKQADVFCVLEKVQEAINDKKQIRCNYFSYTDTLETELVYPESIVINPYELAYKNGRYYLFGALNGNENMLSWRVDRLCDVEKLDSKRLEIPLCREIKDSGGWAAYIDAQPELSGGKVETFKLQCSDVAMDDIVDTFGRDFIVLPHTDKKRFPDVRHIQIRATRDSMKAWAIIHADKVVIMEPEDMRDEIKQILWDSARQYSIAHQSVQSRSRYAKTLEDAIKMAKRSGQTELTYNSRRTRANPDNKERIDTGLFVDMDNIEWLRLSGCEITDPVFLTRFPNLRRLVLLYCRYDPMLLQYAPKLTHLSAAFYEAGDEQVLVNLKHLKGLYLDEIRDCSVLLKLPQLEELEFNNCTGSIDFACLSQLSALRKLVIYSTDYPKDFHFLDSMTQLRELYIESKHFHYEDAVALQKKLPECNIQTRGYHDDEYYL